MCRQGWPGHSRSPAGRSRDRAELSPAGSQGGPPTAAVRTGELPGNKVGIECEYSIIKTIDVIPSRL